jgi:hypothetical protein
MASLADIVAASAGSSPSYGNADLKRKPHDWSTDESAPFGTVPSSLAAPTDESVGQKDAAPYVAPDGGRAEQDRLLAEAKGTLEDPFAKMLERTGNVAAEESRAKYDTPGEAGVRSLGDTAVAMYKGARQIPSDLLLGTLGVPSAIAHGYASIPEGLQAIVDPATWRGMPDAAKEQFLSLANDPETATRLFGGMIAAGPAGKLMESGVARAPGLAGRAISSVGRGVRAFGNSNVVQGTGALRKLGAVLHPGIGSIADAVLPDMLPAAGRGIESLGNKVSNIPNSAAVQGLQKALGADVGATIKDAFTPELTADEQAAAGVRASVQAARDMEAGGMSRAQAAQRSGAPYGGTMEIDPDTGAARNKYGPVEQGTHPGQDVEAHRPYRPAVRGQAGNIIQEGRNSPTPHPPSIGGLMGAIGGLDDLAASPAVKAVGRKGGNFEDALAEFRSQNPSPFETGVGAAKGFSPELMNRPQPEELRRAITEHMQQPGQIREVNLADQTSGERDAYRQAQMILHDKLGDIHHGPAQDISALSSDAALAKLSRGRATSRARKSNTALAEGY